MFSREWTFSSQNMGDSSDSGLSCKIRKKLTLEHRVFERIEIFLIKYGHGNSEFFWKKDVLLTKYRHESNDLFVKNRKKNGHPHFFFVYNIVWF